MSGEEARAYSRQLAFFGLIRVLTFVGRESPAACLASPWLAMSIVDLEAQLGELQGRLSTAKTRVATAKRQLNSECPRRCTPWMRSVAVKLLALSNHDDAVVAKYLAARGRVEQPADVRDWYDSLPLADLPGLLVRQGDPGVLRQLAEAEKFLHEFRLVSWVQEQNEKKGIAPTASAVLDEAGRAWLAKSGCRTATAGCSNACGGGAGVGFASLEGQTSSRMTSLCGRLPWLVCAAVC
jgi:hypothetical protein